MNCFPHIPPLSIIPFAPPGGFALWGSGSSVIAVDSGGNQMTVAFGGNSIPDVPGTTYTLTKGDNGRVLNFTSASAVTVTVPADLPGGFNCGFIQSGAGVVTFVAGAGTSVGSFGGLLSTAGAEATCSIVRKANGTFNLSGNLA